MTYGEGDTGYQAAGGLAGVTALVDRFYDYMDTLPQAKALRAMHSPDLTESKQKLVCFLAGWLGGPNLYAQRFGTISLPVAHSHLPVDDETTKSWLYCMELALKEQGYPVEFREYLMARFATPAESIRLMCKHKTDPSKPSLGRPV